MSNIDKIRAAIERRLRHFDTNRPFRALSSDSEQDDEDVNRALNPRMAEPIAQRLGPLVAALQEQIATLNARVEALGAVPVVQVYEDITIENAAADEITLDMFKSLPIFDGERNKYTAWRTSAKNVMRIFGENTGTVKYFEALSIVRNKITLAASEVLTNYNTAFNFNAIIARLDFVYADQRPIYIIEQEMTILQQGSWTIERFYDEINKKLNVLINKINMTYAVRETAQAMTDEATKKALRVFTTGLAGGLGQILYASNPDTMPDAYAKIQTIINDQERLKFANRFNQPHSRRPQEPNRLNPSFRVRNPQENQQPFQRNQPNTPRDNHQGNQFTRPYAYPRRLFPQRQVPVAEPMDVDRSSMNVNIGDAGKRPRSEGSGQYRKNQRFHNVAGTSETNHVNINVNEPEDYMESSIFLES